MSCGGPMNEIEREFVKLLSTISKKRREELEFFIRRAEEGHVLATIHSFAKKWDLDFAFDVTDKKGNGNA